MGEQGFTGVVDTRNVLDKYKWWDTLDIKDDLTTTKSDLALVLLNFDHDFNIGSSVRNANWFNVGSVWIVGRRSFDTRGCVGAHHYMDINKVDHIDDVFYELPNHSFVAAEIDNRAVSLYDYKFREKTALIIGQESLGISHDVLGACDDIVYIPGRGSCRSLNAANTSGIFLYEYTKQMGL